MSETGIREQAPGALQLYGVLDYGSGPRLRADGQRLIRQSSLPLLTIDCSAVEKSSSVGLALLLAFMRDAAAAGKSLEICGLPEDMREIAAVSGLNDILPVRA